MDNASEIADFEKLSNGLSDNSGVKLVRNHINSGFGAGNNFGVLHATGKYILFLNNDSIINSQVIQDCFHFMESNSTVACCGPQVEDQNGNRRYGFNHFTGFVKEHIGKKAAEFLKGKNSPKIRKRDYQEPIAVDYVNGSFMFFRASDFKSVGGFDTNIFLYYEESDLCYRLKQLGKPTYFLPKSKYVHIQNQSIGKTFDSLQKKAEYNTSLFYVIRKRYGWLYYKLFQFTFCLRFTLKLIAKPKYFPLLIGGFKGFPLFESARQKQQIIF